ncbi:MAG: hypothetical protein KDK08_27290 [Rhizobiaceae bacterium]|nr:hypothetical protein [Rhizobiaceae bacterium]
MKAEFVRAVDFSKVQAVTQYLRIKWLDQKLENTPTVFIPVSDGLFRDGRSEPTAIVGLALLRNLVLEIRFLDQIVSIRRN